MLSKNNQSKSSTSDIKENIRIIKLAGLLADVNTVFCAVFALHRQCTSPDPHVSVCNGRSLQLCLKPPLYSAVCSMTWFTLPVDNLLCRCLGISITVCFTLLLVFIIVPAVLGVSFGVRRLYMRTLLKIFEVSWVSNISRGLWNWQYLDEVICLLITRHTTHWVKYLPPSVDFYSHILFPLEVFVNLEQHFLKCLSRLLD